MSTQQHKLPDAPGQSDGCDGQPYELAAEVVDQTLRLAAHLRGRLHDALATAGLNESRFAVMKRVADRGESGCSQVELAAAMGQCESSICTLIDRMKTDGLVQRLRCTVDRRKSRLHLTDHGVVALAAASQAFAATCGQLEAEWGAAVLAPLRGTLESLLFKLERPVAPAAAAVSAVSKSNRKAA